MPVRSVDSGGRGHCLLLMLLPPGVLLSVSPSASNAPHAEAAPGLVLAAGRYRLIEPLGRGGFGRVWKARDTALNVDVAIKEVSVPPGATPVETAERVKRAAWEARNAAEVRNHPNIVTVYDVIVERGVPWTVMQYVPGRSLGDEIALDGPVPVRLATEVAVAMFSALAACHDAGIIHRDVKPDNIMLAEDGTVMLTDFGIAKQRGQTPMTAEDVVVGSVEYMAPERARGLPATAVSDLFSLGVTLYHAVEGISPFNRGSGMASLSAVLLDELPEPGRAGRLGPLIKQLTIKDPAERLTAEQAVLMLGGRTPTTRAVTARTQISEAPRRRPRDGSPEKLEAWQKQWAADKRRDEEKKEKRARRPPTWWSSRLPRLLAGLLPMGVFLPAGIVIHYDGTSADASVLQCLLSLYTNPTMVVLTCAVLPCLAIALMAGGKHWGPAVFFGLIGLPLLIPCVLGFGLWKEPLDAKHQHIYNIVDAPAGTITAAYPGLGLIAYSIAIVAALALVLRTANDY